MHTRAPALRAGSVAACQARETRASRASPVERVSSVTRSAPWSP